MKNCLLWCSRVTTQRVRRIGGRRNSFDRWYIKMEGVVELAEEIFHMPVRLASPQNVSGLSDVVNNPCTPPGRVVDVWFKQMELGRKPVVRSGRPESVLIKIKKLVQREILRKLFKTIPKMKEKKACLN